MKFINLNYNAYKNCYSLLTLRGFSPAQNAPMVSEEEFGNLITTMADTRGWKVFNRNAGVNYPSSQILLGIIENNIDTHSANIITTYITDYQSNRNNRTKLHIMIIYVGKLQSSAAKTLAPYAIPKISRREMFTYTTPVVELFHVLNLQLDPLKFALQPVIKLISDEEKEELRLNLVASIKEKDKLLEDLLPIITMEEPISVWHGAFINDVFFFHRSIEGEQAYFRIVRPAPPKAKKTTKQEKPK